MATTNFFSQIASLDIEGNLCLTISKGTENNMVVSVLLQNDGCGDNAKQLIQPFIFRGNPQKIGECFFEKIKSPIESTSELFSNMDSYLKSVEDAKKASAMEKSRTEKSKPPQPDKVDKYSEAIKLADQLDSEGRPREAWMVLDRLKGYPDHAEAISAKKKEFSAKFEPTLFASPSENVPQEREQVDAPEREEILEEMQFETLDEDEQEDENTEDY